MMMEWRELEEETKDVQEVQGSHSSVPNYRAELNVQSLIQLTNERYAIQVSLVALDN